MHTKTWSVRIYLSEEDDLTRARAVLDTGLVVHLEGEGVARRNPADPAIAEIGDELAAARALRELADRLHQATAEDISAVTHRPVVTLA